jgi:hypothetical protein
VSTLQPAYLHPAQSCPCRIDLACALSSGTRPFFAPNAIRWDPLFPRDEVASHSSTGMLSMNGRVEEKLAFVFHDLQYLTYAINANVRKHTRWESSSFQHIVNSIQSRLLQLPSTAEQPLSECLRLGMLAFLTTTFAIPGRKIPYTFLATRLQHLFHSSRHEALDAHPTVRLWALVVSAISVLNIEQDWVLEAWRKYGLASGMSWEDTRVRLSSVLWIECVHDEAGRKIFQQLSTPSQSSRPNVQRNSTDRGIPTLLPAKSIDTVPPFGILVSWQA